MPPRRSFLKTVAGAGLATAAFPRRVMGANDRVRVGVIGVGLIGKRHLLDFLAEPDCDVVAIGEVYSPRLEEGLATAGSRASGYRDFRRLAEESRVMARFAAFLGAPKTCPACGVSPLAWQVYTVSEEDQRETGIEYAHSEGKRCRVPM